MLMAPQLWPRWLRVAVSVSESDVDSSKPIPSLVLEASGGEVSSIPFVHHLQKRTVYGSLVGWVARSWNQSSEHSAGAMVYDRPVEPAIAVSTYQQELPCLTR